MIRILSHVGPLPGVAAALTDVEVIPIAVDEPLGDGVRGDVLVTTMSGTPNLCEVLNRGVWWIHTVGTGMDEFPLELERTPPDVVDVARGY